MAPGELKSGFFGYQKASVYQYITRLEEQFSTKLIEKDAEAKKAAAEYQQRIEVLEQELEEARQQCEAQKNEQLVIANTLLEAQRHAEHLKQETAQKQQEAQQRLEEETAKQARELEGYRDQVRQLREFLLTMLKEMDTSAGQLEQKIEQIQASFPEQNLSLFHRREEPVSWAQGSML